MGQGCLFSFSVDAHVVRWYSPRLLHFLVNCHEGTLTVCLCLSFCSLCIFHSSQEPLRTLFGAHSRCLIVHIIAICSVPLMFSLRDALREQPCRWNRELAGQDSADSTIYL